MSGEKKVGYFCDKSEKNYPDSNNMLLITIFCLEAFLGGGGDIFSFSIIGNRITLKMFIFILIMMRYFFLLLKKHRLRVELNKTGLVISVLIYYSFMSFFIGIIAGNSIYLAMTNLKSIFYLVAFIPIISLINSRYASFNYIFKLLIFSSIIISLFSIYVYYTTNYGVVSIYDMRKWLDTLSSDTWLRNNGGFVYPGHLYVLTANLLLIIKTFYAKTNIIEKLCVVLFTFTILISNTRGLILTFTIMVIWIIFTYFRKRIKIYQLTTILLLVVIVFFLGGNIDLSRIFEYRDVSNLSRIQFLEEGIEAWAYSPVIGRGYGYNLATKSALGLEISLFEILLKQGVIGVILWLSYIWSFLNSVYSSRKKSEINELYLKYFTVPVVAMFILSFTNPYLNTTLGIQLVFIIALMYKHEVRFNGNK